MTKEQLEQENSKLKEELRTVKKDLDETTKSYDYLKAKEEKGNVSFDEFERIKKDFENYKKEYPKELKATIETLKQNIDFLVKKLNAIHDNYANVLNAIESTIKISNALDEELVKGLNPKER